MNRLLIFVMTCLVFAACVQKVVISIGINLRLEEVFYPFVLGLCALKVRAQLSTMPPEIKHFIQLKWGFVVFAGMSIILVLLAKGDSGSMLMYVKGIIFLVLQTLMLTVFSLVMVSLSSAHRKWFLNVFVACCVISAVYGLIQLGCIVLFGRDIDQYWVGVFSTDEAVLSGLSRQAVGSFYRLTGLTSDPSVFAAFAITSVPTLLALWICRKSFVCGVLLWIIILALALTMSISGNVGCLVGIAIVLFAFGSHIRPGHVVLTGLVVLLLAPVATYVSTDILVFIDSRLNPEGSAKTHAEIAGNSLALLRDYPFGVGLNNFSVVYGRAHSGSQGMNPHNSFLSCLVELGPFGLVYKLALYGYLCWIAVRSRTSYGRLLLACVVGSCVTALGYETLDLTYIQLFLIVLLCVVAMRDEDLLLKSSSPIRNVIISTNRKPRGRLFDRKNRI